MHVYQIIEYANLSKYKYLYQFLPSLKMFYKIKYIKEVLAHKLFCMKNVV